ncbi:PP2C family serine/threonine-protein phosphatase [Massilia sp. CF038]|uniref:PP2C family protein-serine/threonine phosphatase n=1 Tax=Massilia sp. CF038 TaxID=1881045 RepID=UPI00092265A7|nr:protein phosphatase 2C domain-containing protein [Massilia sp. CF038]SHG98976.1 Serine/threonine protein phosphatase PrpC [Massilia sp. CF038]
MPLSSHPALFAPGLDVAARSEAGAGEVVRAENQDNYLLIDGTGLAHFLKNQRACEQQIPGWPLGHARVAVLDGMGGHGRGREAAEAVVDGLLALPPCTSLHAMSEQLEVLHARLQQQFGTDGTDDKRPGTTLTMLELRAGQAAMLYHVGDSRLYEVQNGRVTPLTIDHVPATACAMAGMLDEGEWWQQVHGEHRSQISQAFILGNAFSNTAELSDPLYALSPLNLPPYLYHLPDRRVLELQAGAVYILASDGFWACAEPVAPILRWPALLESCHSASAMCDALFAGVELTPPLELYPDNLTAIVLRPCPGSETALPVAAA